MMNYKSRDDLYPQLPGMSLESIDILARVAEILNGDCREMFIADFLKRVEPDMMLEKLRNCQMSKEEFLVWLDEQMEKYVSYVEYRIERDRMKSEEEDANRQKSDVSTSDDDVPF